MCSDDTDDLVKTRPTSSCALEFQTVGKKELHFLQTPKKALLEFPKRMGSTSFFYVKADTVNSH